ncbi:hypothetical protein SAMN06265347_10770 [Halobellus salinus]|nr:hypothetical protein SAMN06265347_10770 [Halobellus salinus]
MVPSVDGANRKLSTIVAERRRGAGVDHPQGW